jgi:hypothetical protein
MGREPESWCSRIPRAEGRGVNVLGHGGLRRPRTDHHRLRAQRRSARWRPERPSSANLKPQDVDCVNARHLDAGQRPDRDQRGQEGLGEHAYEIPVSSTKSVVGHSRRRRGVARSRRFSRSTTASPVQRLPEEPRRAWTWTTCRGIPSHLSPVGTTAHGGGLELVCLRGHNAACDHDVTIVASGEEHLDAIPG